ncbi:MAG: hypothetical protein M3Q60_23440 [Actinomycetota bacterium]|nr:hypothetical protein [Actinomycetota bacterium]
MADRAAPERPGALSDYLRRAARRPLLTAGQERRLAQAVRARGDARANAALLQVLGGREPKEDDLAEHLGWTPQAVREALGALPDAASLDAPVRAGEENGAAIGDLVGAAEEPGPYGEPERDPDAVVARASGLCGLKEGTIVTLEEARALAALERALGSLPPRHRHVVVRRYGLLGHERGTLKEVGAELGITRERARQLQKTAEDVLRGDAALRAATADPGAGAPQAPPHDELGRSSGVAS